MGERASHEETLVKKIARAVTVSFTSVLNRLFLKYCDIWLLLIVF